MSMSRLAAVARLLTPAKSRQAAVYAILSELGGRMASPTGGAAEALESAKSALFEQLRQHFASPLEAKAVALKILNLCLARQQFLSNSVDPLSRPFGLVVDPANSCNLACPGCVHSRGAKELKLFDWNPGILPEPRYSAFLKLYGPSALHITLCNYGEPLVNPATPRFIRLAKTHLLRTMLSTNISLPRFDAEAYAESGLDYMVLSIDGATQPVYERFRRNGKLDLVLDNIRKLVDAKRKSGRSTPILTWRFLAFEHNLHEIPLALEKARELGVDQFRAEPAWDISWDDPEIRAAAIEPVVAFFSDSTERALLDNWNPFPADLDAEAIEREFDSSPREFDSSLTDRAGGRESAPSVAPAGSSCEWLYKNLTMDAGGRIFPCCCSPRPNADLTFAQFDAGAPGDPFRSSKHQRSRLFFADPEGFRRNHAAPDRFADPYCMRCEWDKAADPSREQIRVYFKNSAPDLFDARCLNLLASW